jgi:soluble lytic murein transglycosylase-like protein
MVIREIPRLAQALLSAVLLASVSCSDAKPRAAVTPSASPTPSPSPTQSPSPSPSPTTSALEDPATLARELVAAERAIRSDTPATEAVGRVQQASYRKLVLNPDWRDPVRSQVPQDLRGAFDANLTAGTELRKLVKPLTSLPNWRIVPPPPAEELRGYYGEVENRFGIRWQYIASIHLVESRMGRIRGTSTAGAQGPMQFLPSTWKRWGEGDINDPRDSILAAGRFLQGHGAPADMPRALHAYNPADRYVRAVTLYAELMLKDPRTYYGYYHWQVYVITTGGDVLLEVGYGQ